MRHSLVNWRETILFRHLRTKCPKWMLALTVRIFLPNLTQDTDVENAVRV
jgi:hypothetical protein